MKRITAAAALSLAAFVFVPVAFAFSEPPLPKASAADVGMSQQRLDRITATFKSEVDQNKLPGTVIMVARKGRLVYSQAIGFQDKAANTPMSMDSVFRIYSMTKPLASVAATMLMEEGRLQLTDPVSKWLPEFATLQVSEMRTDPWGKVTYALVPAERQPTVQDLLRHTAGLAYGELTGNAAVKDA
jgi:CubicO group peptidase (beta-lactamase class C family)